MMDFVPGAPFEGEEVSAEAGAPLADGSAVAATEDVIEALRTVHDPEIPVNIYELGLIYECDIGPSGDVSVIMTVTAPACPVAGILPQQVADAVAEVRGTGRVDVRLVWDPPWDQSRMSEAARLELGMM